MECEGSPRSSALTLQGLHSAGTPKVYCVIPIEKTNLSGKGSQKQRKEVPMHTPQGQWVWSDALHS